MSQMPPEELNKINIELMKHWFEMARARSRAVVDLSLVGLKTLLVLNGGAIVAIFTFLGHADKVTIHENFLYSALGSYVTGASLSLLSLLSGFISQNIFITFEQTEAHNIYARISGGEIFPAKNQSIGNLCWYFAVIVAFGSLIAFFVGSLLAFEAIKVAGSV